MNEQGNLVSITNIEEDENVFGIPTGENKNLTSEDIQKAIFETDNVAMPKND